MSNTIIVGIGGIGLSNKEGDIIKTLALGSCVGVMLYSPKLKLAGLIHIALPESRINPELAKERPCYFADTGIPFLFNSLTKFGCLLYSDLVVKIAGGANIMDPQQRFDIGTRNVLAVKKNLWRYKLGPLAEDTADTISRTVKFEVDTGRITLSSPSIGEWEI